MLVLSRKQHEKIVIGDVVVTVLAVQGQRVRLGIEAPDWVAVRRHELTPRDAATPVRGYIEFETTLEPVLS